MLETILKRSFSAAIITKQRTDEMGQSLFSGLLRPLHGETMYSISLC